MTVEKSHISQPFAIGTVVIPNRLVQAPMAGISGRAFRLQARRFGVGLAVTEMVSSFGVHYGNQKTLSLLELGGERRPVAVQLFGTHPGVMAEAAVAAEEAGADIIDINMGCPARKVARTGAGVALMRDEGLAARIAAAMVAAVAVPVTAKIRSGPGSRITAPSLAGRLQDAGVAAISIHPRLGAQGRKGRADHSVTGRLVESLKIPVVASGGVATSADVARLLGDTGCAAVMVGRAALGNPWLFSGLLAGNGASPMPLPVVLEEMEIFYRDLVMEMGEERAARHMRKFYGWYLAPLGAGPRLKNDLRGAMSFTQAKQLISAAGTVPRLWRQAPPAGTGVP